MANKERNALAELAEELERFSAENKGLFARRNHLILHRAQRIIAELAKVSDGEWVKYIGGYFYVCRKESRVVETAIGTCREIAAEEGAY